MNPNPLSLTSRLIVPFIVVAMSSPPSFTDRFELPPRLRAPVPGRTGHALPSVNHPFQLLDECPRHLVPHNDTILPQRARLAGRAGQDRGLMTCLRLLW